MSDSETLQYCTEKFIALANELKDEGVESPLISAALMSASGIYVTYSVAGNDGALEPSGVDKVVSKYRQNLENIQQLKKAEIQGGTA